MKWRRHKDQRTILSAPLERHKRIRLSSTGTLPVRFSSILAQIVHMREASKTAQAGCLCYFVYHSTTPNGRFCGYFTTPHCQISFNLLILLA
jgi:hypothetical protein